MYNFTQPALALLLIAIPYALVSIAPGSLLSRPLLRNNRNSLYLEQIIILKQRLHPNEGAGGRLRAVHIHIPHLTQRRQILRLELLDVPADLDDIVKARSGRRQRRLQVLEHLYRLCLQIAFANQLPLPIVCHLTCDKDQPPRPGHSHMRVPISRREPIGLQKFCLCRGPATPEERKRENGKSFHRGEL